MILRPEQLIIPEEKILNYLLVKKEKNDKSEFLKQLGYTVMNYQELIEEIRLIASTYDMILSRTSEFGDLYKIEGPLKNSLIVTIWIEKVKNNTFQFVTLYPAK